MDLQQFFIFILNLFIQFVSCQLEQRNDFDFYLYGNDHGNNATVSTSTQTRDDKQFEGQVENSELFLKFMSECLPPEAQTKFIECNFHTSNILHRHFEVSCIQPGIIRFVGEFDVLTIRCSAKFHLDFDFDGVQPTEAIKVTSWKEVDMTLLEKVVSAYHIVLKIYSNKALYDLHSIVPTRRKMHKGNSTTEIPSLTMRSKKSNLIESINQTTTNMTKLLIPRHEYSRSGRYVIRGMFNVTTRFPLYLFFEEPSQEETLTFNSYTIISVDRKGLGLSMTVPCRPSHYNSTVELRQTHPNFNLTRIDRGILWPESEYHPWIGFIIPLQFNSTVLVTGDIMEFDCVLKSKKLQDVQITFTFPSDKGKQFGFNGISPQTSMRNKITMNHEANLLVALDPITVNITCVIQDQDETSNYMGSIGCENPMHLRLVREFILTGHQDKSYTVHQTTKLVGDSYPYELKIFGAFQTGITYCFSGPYSRIYEYAAGLNRVMYQLDFGTDYTSLPHTSPRKEVHIHLQLLVDDNEDKLINLYTKLSNNSVRLVVGQNYSFACRIDLFTVAKTILWDVKFKNGSISREKIDYDFSGEFSYFVMVVRWDVARIFCSAPFWNNNKWRTDDLEIIPGDMSEQTKEEVDKYTKMSFAVVGLLLVFIAIVILLIRKFRFTHKEFSKAEILEFELGNPGLKTEMGFSEGGHHLPYDKQYEIDETKFIIDYKRILGSGQFGIVYKGTISREDECHDVAIKTVKPNVDKMYTKALLSELKIMIYLGKHPHLIELIGASTAHLRRGALFILIEFCSRGSLENYLRKNRHQLQSQTYCVYTQLGFVGEDNFSNGGNEETESTLTLQDLYTWTLEVAQGMNYLSTKNVVHGDIATRNVLLTNSKVAKICDFGLSRRLHNYKIYSKTKSQPLPWPWLAPESLTNLVFSTRTDVWAFGITVWEIFSLGQVPYPGMNCTLDFVSKIKEGLRNLKPALASEDLFRDIMKECWRFEPEDRPSFNELCFTLEDLCHSHNVQESSQLTPFTGSIEADVTIDGYFPHNLAFSNT